VATIVAMKPSLQQSALVAEQRLAGAVIAVLGALAGSVRAANYAWYCAAVAGAVLIGMDLPHRSHLADEGRRILFTFAGVGIAVIVMFLASQFSKRAQARSQYVSRTGFEPVISSVLREPAAARCGGR
jgi:hypothetical protein